MESSAVLRPPRLRPHGCIGIVAPAGPSTDLTRLERGVRYFEGLGYRTKVAPHAAAVHGHLAGTDAERAADVMAMFEDPDVHAILCLRGGFGSTRILPLLDYGIIARHPKILCGFSDITALQLAIWRHSRLVTFHGPMVGPDFAGTVDPLTEASFWETVSEGNPPRHLPLGEPSAAVALFPGAASGRLLGGNLSILSTMMGTRFVPSFEGALLFIEEVGEEPYRVDRALTHLGQAGVFSAAAGILAGSFSDCTSQHPDRPTRNVDLLLADLAEQLCLPFVAGCRFGHIPTKMVLPVGIVADLDAESRTLRYREPAVF